MTACNAEASAHCTIHSVWAQTLSNLRILDVSLQVAYVQLRYASVALWESYTAVQLVRMVADEQSRQAAILLSIVAASETRPAACVELIIRD